MTTHKVCGISGALESHLKELSNTPTSVVEHPTAVGYGPMEHVSSNTPATKSALDGIRTIPLFRNFSGSEIPFVRDRCSRSSGETCNRLVRVCLFATSADCSGNHVDAQLVEGCRLKWFGEDIRELSFRRDVQEHDVL